MNNLEVYKKHVETCLEQRLPKVEGPFGRLYEAMAYSVKAGGKRIRPILMQLTYEAVGGSQDISAYWCAIEMIHTYSLVHDDLPAMDNDDLRRGKPTNHIMFGEATAILAGDALLNYAFEMMLEDALEHEDMNRVRAAHVLGEASGGYGMIAGQILDMASEGQSIDLDTLDCIHLHKTGALIAAATKMGAILGGGSPLEIAACETYGKYLGKVFQIIDDILDKTSTTDELGKPIHSDEKNAKNTYLSFYSVEACYEIAERLTQKALDCLDKVPGDTTLLREIALELVHRRQ
ncbi:MAG: polyprenyl synthetase family protein [Cellulosilyticaceae bacterium]